MTEGFEVMEIVELKNDGRVVDAEVVVFDNDVQKVLTVVVRYRRDTHSVFAVGGAYDQKLNLFVEKNGQLLGDMRELAMAHKDMLGALN